MEKAMLALVVHLFVGDILTIVEDVISGQKIKYFFPFLI